MDKPEYTIVSNNIGIGNRISSIDEFTPSFCIDIGEP